MFKTGCTPKAGPPTPWACIIEDRRGWVIYIPDKNKWIGPGLETISGEDPFGTNGLKENFKVPSDAVAFNSYEAAKKATVGRYKI
ncbi:MAG: hypothetical protein UX65_C0007G0005 [Parcubacteria group bacterium GW2011_GWB1_46_8]|nr:MAG: hypothetical protein UX14_C0021G0001 [Parcubacteria group bacterium GW2011_GWF1_45_5]KKU10322.1 MAG: hypothetical protein UX15_C0033G0011 [Parcubacteria group bacterium GW2011_GWA1_45_7]KKU46202.1 MAG: hypothetical protein UX65_C0007G0005 [Parcubacteria group bacterium GW2011_GWB1_46_8]